MSKFHVKKGDHVVVLAGKEKGKQGKIIAVLAKKSRVIVEGTHMIKKHTRKNPQKQIAGGIAEKESPIAVSNVMILCGKCGAVRIKHHVVEVAGGRPVSDARRGNQCRRNVNLVAPLRHGPRSHACIAERPIQRVPAHLRRPRHRGITTPLPLRNRS